MYCNRFKYNYFKGSSADQKIFKDKNTKFAN